MKYFINWNGTTKTMREWCRTLHISESFFSKRYRNGMGIEEICAAHEKAKVRRAPIPGKEETLCWTCLRDGRTCPWMRNETPVEGWDAEPTRKQYYDTDTRTVKSYRSYMIRACPLYVTKEKESDAWQDDKEQKPGA